MSTRAALRPFSDLLLSVCGVVLLLAAHSPAAAGPEPRSGDEGAALELHDYREPDRTVDGFPVWLGRDRVLDRVVVLVEGLDLFNRMDARGIMRMVSPVADVLEAEGLDALVVDFPDSHLAPDDLAPHLDRAIRSAAKAAGRPVIVAGLSGGGITARWALVAAEERGEPLPVSTLMLLDSPNRGAWLNPGLHALTTRFGTREDRRAVESPGARALITSFPTQVRWKRVGPPFARRKVPVAWTADSSGSEAFFARLHALNDRRGYPKQCRVIAVSQGARPSAPAADACPAPAQTPQQLFKMWLPFGASWSLRCEPEDSAAGSMLPVGMTARYRVRLPLGIAGSSLRRAPTFVSSVSSLDAAPGEEPPFDEWYARAADLPRIGHDGADRGAIAFILAALRRATQDPAPAPAAGFAAR